MENTSRNNEIINRSIVNSMREGVFTLDRTGHITSMNPAAESILNVGADVVGKPFFEVFFNDEEPNDAFCEAILSAVYQNTVTHNALVSYRTGGTEKQLFMSTSYLTNGSETIGMTAVINDITELNELRDAVRAMERIRALNAELEKRNAFIKQTFGRYLSDEIVSELLEKEDGLEIGGRKQDVTVMFTDIRGFTALSESMPPADLIAMLNHYLERMIGIIMENRGTILEFIGDAIVAVFGAPLESETRCADAVTCAVSMQAAMADVNAYNESRGYPAIEMGIGIHDGDVVLGNIGSSRKAKYDIIGRNVNLASRVESYTVGGQVLISDRVKDALGSALVVGKSMTVQPKGVRSPVVLWEVRAIGALRMPGDEQHFTPVDPPLPLVCFPLDGKHTASEGFPALLCALSEKELLLRTDTELPFASTVSITLPGGELFAKVTEPEAGPDPDAGSSLVRLRLTSGSSSMLVDAIEAR